MRTKLTLEQIQTLNKIDTENVGGVITVDGFWECECGAPARFIYPDHVEACEYCGMRREDAPNARIEDMHPLNICIGPGDLVIDWYWGYGNVVSGLREEGAFWIEQQLGPDPEGKPVLHQHATQLSMVTWISDGERWQRMPWRYCYDCMGTGVDPVDDEACPSCQGLGFEHLFMHRIEDLEKNEVRYEPSP